MLKCHVGKLAWSLLVLVAGTASGQVARDPVSSVLAGQGAGAIDGGPVGLVTLPDLERSAAFADHLHVTGRPGGLAAVYVESGGAPFLAAYLPLDAAGRLELDLLRTAIPSRPVSVHVVVPLELTDIATNDDLDVPIDEVATSGWHPSGAGCPGGTEMTLSLESEKGGSGADVGWNPNPGGLPPISKLVLPPGSPGVLTSSICIGSTECADPVQHSLYKLPRKGCPPVFNIVPACGDSDLILFCPPVVDGTETNVVQGGTP